MPPKKSARPTARDRLRDICQVVPDWLARGMMRSGLEQTARHHLTGPDAVPILLEKLFPDRDPDERRRIGRNLVLNEQRNSILSELIPTAHFGWSRKMFRSLEDSPLHQLQREGRAAVITFLHTGPRFAIGPALASLGMRAMVFARATSKKLQAKSWTNVYPRMPTIQYVGLGDGSTLRAYALKAGIDALREGRMVAVALDGRQGEKFEPYPFLGRTVSLGPGPALLARIAKVPLVPIYLSWARRGLSIVPLVGEPIFPGEGDGPTVEATLTRTAVSWLEEQVLKDPAQLRVGHLKSLLGLKAKRW